MRDESNLGLPWRRQRELKKEHIPDISQVIEMVDRFEYIHEQALFILAYQTAGRISELVQTPFLRKVKYLRQDYTKPDGTTGQRVARNINNSPVQEGYDKLEINYPGILVRDLTFTNRRGKNILIVRMANRKNPNFKKKNIPIPVDKEPEFVEIIKRYIYGLDKNQPLFPFRTWTAERILAKVGMNPHFLRDIRLTHLVMIYGYNAHQLVKFAGWQNISPAERYVRLSVDDLVINF